MVLTGNLPTALAALALGTALLGLFVLSLRLFRAHGPQPAQPLPSPVANAQARTLFGLNGDQPSLSVVLRQTQPADRLLGLLAGEGQASLHIGDRRIEATSHRLPLPASGPTRYVVVLRETERAAELPESGDEGAVVRVLAEIKRALSTSLDLDETCYVILAGLAQAFHFHLAELNLRDEAAQELRAARHTGGHSAAMDAGPHGAARGR